VPAKRFFVSLALLAGFYLLLSSLERGPVMVAAKNLDRLPHTIADYQGTDYTFEAAVMEELDPDVSVSRQLLPPEGSGLTPLFLYVGYYGTAKGGRTGHNPYACYPGAGWAIISNERVEVPFGGRQVQVNQIVVRRGSEEEVVLFWYQSAGDRIIVSGLQQNLNRFFGRILHGRDDGAFVRLSAPVTGEVGPVSEQLRSLAAQLMPELSRYWPQEREVGA
jgi:EpsI family protein